MSQYDSIKNKSRDVQHAAKTCDRDFDHLHSVSAEDDKDYYIAVTTLRSNASKLAAAATELERYCEMEGSRLRAAGVKLI